MLRRQRCREQLSAWCVIKSDSLIKFTEQCHTQSCFIIRRISTRWQPKGTVEVSTTVNCARKTTAKYCGTLRGPPRGTCTSTPVFSRHHDIELRLISLQSQSPIWEQSSSLMSVARSACVALTQTGCTTRASRLSCWRQSSVPNRFNGSKALRAYPSESCHRTYGTPSSCHCARSWTRRPTYSSAPPLPKCEGMHGSTLSSPSLTQLSSVGSRYGTAQHLAVAASHAAHPRVPSAPVEAGLISLRGLPQCLQLVQES